MGAASIEITPLLPQLLDVYGVGIRKQIEFLREKKNADDKPAVVGRISITLKMVGDYLTKFDSAAEGKDGPKKATGELHVLPPEAKNFSWRVRCDVRAGVNMPLNDVV